MLTLSQLRLTANRNHYATLERNELVAWYSAYQDHDSEAVQSRHEDIACIIRANERSIACRLSAHTSWEAYGF